jgi:nitrogen fixation/metabolism regulation signal transduction histidine kinase
MVIGPVNRTGTGMVPMLGLFVLLLVSLSYMSDATHNSERFGQMYSWLLLVNASALVILGVLVVANLVWLIGRQRKKAPGARMTTRLVVMFVILSVVPVSVVYYFSLQFLQRGIDSWFDVRIEQGLDDALVLSRAALDVRLRDVLEQTATMAEELSKSPYATISIDLYDLRVRSGASELTLFDGGGRAIASSSVDLTNILPSQPTPEMLLIMSKGQHYIGLDPVGESGLYARALIPLMSSREDNEIFTLQGLYPVSERFSALAAGVQTALTRYKELAYLRTPLKFSYTLTLSIVLMLSLLAAIWAAFHSARRLAAPISDLAEATQAVAEGDYSKRLPVASEDELGFLVRSFNDMTRRLEKARDQARRGRKQIEGQRAYLEVVLASLSSGVISLDADMGMRAVNRTASQSLGVDFKGCLGKALSVIAEEHVSLKPFVDVILQHRRNKEKTWQEEISLFGANGRQVLMCRGTDLQVDGKHSGGQVIVFDDVTALIQAERDAAWGEVARRLAHEIKNPLTPIQLSAERLRRRYLDDMDKEDAEFLDRATNTIVSQVEAMKKMVNAFSEYARAPKISLEPIDLNAIITQVMDLYSSSDLNTKIIRQLHSESTRIEGDAGRIRQLLHNLVKNGLEAVNGKADARIIVATRTMQIGGVGYIELSISDNGPGFEPGVLDNLFEPYISTKAKGSGLGLAIVKKIVEEHGGLITAENVQSGGALVQIRLQLLNEDVGADDTARNTSPETPSSGNGGL